MNSSKVSVSVYLIAAIVGLSLLGIGAIWGAAHLWYHISLAARMAIAVVLLMISQLGVGVALFQEREGSLLAEGIAAVHCVTVFVSLVITEQTFYVGWHVSSYLAAAALLCLPAVYLLRSLAAVVIYAVAVLAWAVADGPLVSSFGAASLWGLLILLVPFYQVLLRHHEEKRLLWYAWIMTGTVFLSLGITSKNAAYSPFLLVSALGSFVLLLGYTVDTKKSWGLPLRWLGRAAGIVALLFSSLPAPWQDIAALPVFPWFSSTLTILFCAGCLGLLWRGVKRRLWSPVVYSVIPFLIGVETIVVRSGVYTAVPLILSTIYVLAIGFFEIGQGIQNTAQRAHLKWGIAVLLAVVVACIGGTSALAAAPVVVIVVLVLVMLQLRRTKQSRQAAAARSARRIRLHRQRKDVQVKAQTAEKAAEREPAAPPTAAEEDLLPEWMKDLHIPEPQPTAPTSEAMPAQMNTVTTKPEPKSLFVAPVFHEPEEMPLAHVAVPAETNHEPVETAQPAGSPWQSGQPETKTKRPKRFTHSPWSQEGGTK